MTVLDDSRVTERGSDFLVTISHGRYVVEYDDRNNLWWAYDVDGLALARRVNCEQGPTPESCGLDASDACSGWDTAEELIVVLLAFDGQAVPA